MNTLQITVPIDIDLSRLDDLLVTALEGGAGYWCPQWKEVSRARPYSGTPGVYPYCTAFTDGMIMKVKEDCGEGDRPKWHDLYLERAIKGLVLMAQKSPNHFADWMNENDDAITADVWLQYAVLGEIRYG